MKPAALFGLMALLPAAIGPAAPAQGGTVTALLCAEDGIARTVSIPLDPARPGPDESRGCCKGCHGGNSRKRGQCHI